MKNLAVARNDPVFISKRQREQCLQCMFARLGKALLLIVHVHCRNPEELSPARERGGFIVRFFDPLHLHRLMDAITSFGQSPFRSPHQG